MGTAEGVIGPSRSQTGSHTSHATRHGHTGLRSLWGSAPLDRCHIVRCHWRTPHCRGSSAHVTGRYHWPSSGLFCTGVRSPHPIGALSWRADGHLL